MDMAIPSVCEEIWVSVIDGHLIGMAQYHGCMRKSVGKWVYICGRWTIGVLTIVMSSHPLTSCDPRGSKALTSWCLRVHQMCGLPT